MKKVPVNRVDPFGESDDNRVAVRAISGTATLPSTVFFGPPAVEPHIDRGDPADSLLLSASISMVPGVAEYADYATLKDPDSKWWEKGLVIGSLGASALTGGILPNAGPILQACKHRLHFKGMEVRAVRDLSHVDESTLKAMAKKGFASNTINGDQFVLHHLDQDPAGPVVDMPRRNNDISNPVQHPYGNTPGAGLADEQRAAFDKSHQDYWRWRAKQELTRRAAGQ